MELYEHNIKPYNELRKLAVGERAVFVTATGTGKSYVAGKIIEDSSERVLVVTPKRAISKQWRDLLAGHMNRVDVCTYQKLAMMKPQGYRKTFSLYGFVVFDEVHHAGAKSWGKPVTYCLNHAKELGISVLGLTADPVRYTDGGYDVGQEMFSGERVDGLMLEEAIEQGVLPAFNYVSALYEYPEDIVRAKKSGTGVAKKRQTTLNRLLGRLDIGNDNLTRITEIVQNNLKASSTPMDKRHVVIFVASVDDFGNAKRFARKVGLRNIFESSYKMSQKKNEAALKGFEAAESAALICVDMLNEGVHCKAVDTVVMLRRTGSPTIFFQQLGRALDSGSKKDIWVFDFVANAKSLNISSTIGDEKIVSVSKVVRKCCKQKITKDYATECLDLISEIRRLIADQVLWTEEEDAILQAHYEKEGSDCFKLLPNRSAQACYRRAMLLGLKRPDVWSDEELDILRKYYPTEGAAVAKRLVGKDDTQIANACHRLGIKVNPLWSEKDDKIMLKYYPTEGTEIVKRLSKPFTKRQVVTHAATLGIKKDSAKWTSEEDAVLRRYYPDKEKCLKYIHNRTWTGIVRRASVLGLTKEPNKSWSEEELAFLRENAATMSTEDMAKHLGRTVGSVRTKRQRLGVEGMQANLWTSEEDAIIREFYPTMSWQELLEKLKGRTDAQIKQRASKLHIRRRIYKK